MFISIVTVCFNSEKTIERTIKSILQQEFKDYEYLIIDGGSNDGTLDIIREFEPLFEGRMKWKSEPDKGIYDAFNKGCKWANGDYIWIVNSDDWAEDKSLEKLYNYAKINDPQNHSILAAGINLIDHVSLRRQRTGFGSKDYYVKNSLMLNMGLSHPSAVIPKKIYESIGYYDDRYYISGDVDFVLRCFRAKVSILFPQIIISNMTDGGISNSYCLNKYLHDFNIRLKKFCNNPFKRILYRCKYIAKIFILNKFGFLFTLYMKCK